MPSGKYPEDTALLGKAVLQHGPGKMRQPQSLASLLRRHTFAN